MNLWRVARVSVLVGSLWLLCERLLPMWRLRLASAQLFLLFPNSVLPTSLTVLPPPQREYVGVWNVSPTEARRRLTDELPFRQVVRAYLHAYDRAGFQTYEVGSCVYRPRGLFGRWQLHVRLFPTPDGMTDVWCHWELNPNVAPIAHLKKEGYDTDRGKKELKALLDDPIEPPEDLSFGKGSSLTRDND